MADGPRIIHVDNLKWQEVRRQRHGDREVYERFLAERGVEQLRNPPIDMPAWLEDTRS